MENRIGERVSSLESITDHQEKRISKIEDRQEILHRLTINQETLTQIVKENKEEMRNFSDTLSMINSNLNQLNQSQEDLRKSHEELKVELKENVSRLDSKVEKVEKTQAEEKDNNTLDLSGLPKKIILWAVGVSLTALSAWIMIKLNLK